MDVPASKVCTKCGEEKALGEFYLSKKYRDGRQSYCKACDLANQKARKAAKPKNPKRPPTPEASDQVNNKVCCSCLVEKPKSEFCKSNTKDKLDPRCRSCRKVDRVRNSEKIKTRSRRHYELNRDRIIEASKKYYEENREARLSYLREWQKSNPEKLKNGRRDYYLRFSDKVKRNSRGYYRENREERVAYKRRYLKENYEKVRDSRRKYWRNNRHKRMAYARVRYKKDTSFRLRVKMKNMLGGAVKRYGLSKTKTLKDLGYTPEDLRARLEVQFKPGMSWDNFGEWHIDHKIPVARFVAKGETRQWVIHALSNLQPMWAEENWRKGNRWIG